MDDRLRDSLLQELDLRCEEELERRLARLVCLIPDLRPRLQRLQPRLLASLMADERETGQRMVLTSSHLLAYHVY